MTPPAPTTQTSLPFDHAASRSALVPLPSDDQVPPLSRTMTPPSPTATTSLPCTATPRSAPLVSLCSMTKPLAVPCATVPAVPTANVSPAAVVTTAYSVASPRLGPLHAPSLRVSTTSLSPTATALGPAATARRFQPGVVVSSAGAWLADTRTIVEPPPTATNSPPPSAAIPRIGA